jgi:hypothetical protein
MLSVGGAGGAVAVEYTFRVLDDVINETSDTHTT